MTDTPDVVVIGGGIAGIVAALAAAKRGLKVTLLEKGPRLAGRARSWLDPKMKDPVPIGPHIFVDIYHGVFKLLEELGTSHKVVWQKDPACFMTWVEGQRETEIRYATSLPAPFSFSPGLLNLIKFFPEIEQADVQSTVAITLYAFKLSEAEMLELDNETATSVLRRFNVTERFINVFFTFVAHSIFNVPLEELSGCALLRFYRVLVGTSSLRIGFPDCGLGDLFTPAEQVLKDLGADVRLRTRVASLEGSKSSCDGVVLESGEVLRPRVGVVSTLPAYHMTDLLHKEWLGNPQLRAATEMKPCSYICIYFWFDRKLTKRDFWARTFQEESLTCDWYDFSNIYADWGDRPSFIGTNMIDTDVRDAGKLTDEEILDGVFKELCEYLPEARDAKILHTQITHVPCAIHRPVVGTEKARVTPGRFADVNGLFFAGDWCATEMPYCMDSAARAGWTCAESILKEAEAKGVKTQGSTGLRVPVPDIDTIPRMLSTFDVFRPLSLLLTEARIGAARRQENAKARSKL